MNDTKKIYINLETDSVEIRVIPQWVLLNVIPLWFNKIKTIDEIILLIYVKQITAYAHYMLLTNQILERWSKYIIPLFIVRNCKQFLFQDSFLFLNITFIM